MGQPDLEVAHPLTRLLLVGPPGGLGGGRIEAPAMVSRKAASGRASKAAVALQTAKRPSRHQAVGYGVCRTRPIRRTLGEQEKHQRMQPATERRQHVEQGNGDEQAGVPTGGQKAGQICSQASAPRASPNLKRGSSVPFIPAPVAPAGVSTRGKNPLIEHAGTCSAASISSTVGRRRTTAWLDPETSTSGTSGRVLYVDAITAPYAPAERNATRSSWSKCGKTR